MRLLSLNVSQPVTVDINGEPTATGIFKTPVDGAVMLRTLNLDGDGQADLKNHGGVDKAVYLYPFEHYAYWSERVGRDDFVYGQFGENLTTEGILEDSVHLGDTFRIGATALVQAVQPRYPCFKLAHKMGISDFVQQFQDASKPGIYFRVLEEGPIQAGDAFEPVEVDTERVTIHDMYFLFYNWRDHRDAVRHMLANEPNLPQGLRKSLAKRVGA